MDSREYFDLHPDVEAVFPFECVCFDDDRRPRISLDDYVEDYSVLSPSDQLDFLKTIFSNKKLVDDIVKRVFPEASPKDLFVQSLANLRDTGDIDSLVRALNWQHNDISYLSHQLVHYESSLRKLDELRVTCARLRDSAEQLRKRNSELITALREANVKIPKSSKSNEKPKKNPRSSR